MALCDDSSSVDDLINSISQLSIKNSPKEFKQSAKQLLNKLSTHKLNKLIDIVTELQRNNIKDGFDIGLHRCCNNILLMIIDRKRELID